MKPNYKNWVPMHMIAGGWTAFSSAVTALISFFAAGKNMNPKVRKTGIIVSGILTLGSGAFAGLFTLWYRAFDYNGKRQMSKQIIDGIAAHVDLPEGGKGLDVGCGSGALTIAVAKRNPQAQMTGIDRWGLEYSSYNKKLCESNAEAEGVSNTSFMQGDACHLDFPDETFDAVTSNYVYHNITGVNKQKLLKETLRVLKKGGTFAIHDIMTPGRYGDMEAFARELYAEGYEDVQMIDTSKGMFMTEKEGKILGLAGSTLLLGKK